MQVIQPVEEMQVLQGDTHATQLPLLFRQETSLHWMHAVLLQAQQLSAHLLHVPVVGSCQYPFGQNSQQGLHVSSNMHCPALVRLNPGWQVKHLLESLLLHVRHGRLHILTHASFHNLYPSSHILNYISEGQLQKLSGHFLHWLSCRLYPGIQAVQVAISLKAHEPRQFSKHLTHLFLLVMAYPVLHRQHAVTFAGSHRLHPYEQFWLARHFPSFST